jgi:hypothetical protein
LHLHDAVEANADLHVHRAIARLKIEGQVIVVGHRHRHLAIGRAGPHFGGGIDDDLKRTVHRFANNALRSALLFGRRDVDRTIDARDGRRLCRPGRMVADLLERLVCESFARNARWTSTTTRARRVA